MCKKFFVFDQPGPRDQHTLTKVGSLLYMFGGVVSPDGRVLDELWTIDTASVNWNSKTLELPGVIYERQKYVGGGDNVPGSLRGHAAVCYNESMIIIIGGARLDNTKSNEVFKYDVDSKEWSTVNLKGIGPVPRSHH